jgi:putative hydrolase of the HAD superfamily
MSTRAIIFDYGHTLVDLAATAQVILLYREGLREVLARHCDGRTDLLEAAERALRSVDEAIRVSFTTRRQIQELDLFDLLRAGLAAEGIALPAEALQRVVEMDHQVYGALSRVSPETVATLEALKARGYLLGVISNTVFLRRWIHHLPLLGPGGLLDALLLSTDLGLRKPHPLTYQTVLARLGVPKEEALFVGDRIVEDIRGPREFGIPRAILTHEYRQEEDERGEAEARISRLAELPALLD